MQEAQTPLDLYTMVICVELAQSKQASEPPLLGKNIPKDHDGIFSPVLPTSIPVLPIDINLAFGIHFRISIYGMHQFFL